MNSLVGGRADHWKEPVIANDPASDHRRGGAPTGHPRCGRLWGYRWSGAGKRWHGGLGQTAPVGMTQPLVEYLAPLLETVGSILAAVQHQERKHEAGRSWWSAAGFVEGIFNAIPQPLYVIDVKDHTIC